jgi:branched-chain amino acid transport system permease protein
MADWWAGSTLLRHLALLAGGVALVIVLTASVSGYQNYQLATFGAYLCAVAGLTVLTGTNGQVSLGHAALMAIGGYTVALMQTRFTDNAVTGVWVLPVSLLVGMVATAVAGVVVGVAAARLRGPYLAGATLAFGVALPSITSHFSGVFKGDQGLLVPFEGPPAGLGASFTLEHWQAWISLSAAALVLFFLANLQRSSFGRHMRAVRDDEIASALCGLSVARVQIAAFAVSSAAAGLGGGVFAFVLQSASPGSFSLVLSLTLLSAVIIGGLGSLAGAVWGSVVVVYLGTFITDHVDALNLSASWSQNLHDNLPGAVYGLLLILVMLRLPAGIQGLLRRLSALFRGAPPNPQEVPDGQDDSTRDGGDGGSRGGHRPHAGGVRQ